MFSLPVSFIKVSELVSRGAQSSGHLVAASLGTSEPSALLSWTSEDQGIALGCHDGTIYVFGPIQQDKPGRGERKPGSIGSQHPHYSSQSTSRSVSPSNSSTLTQPPFSISSRSRIVSGITTEAVEAPKNFVDFDDEPGKLKEMLKARVPKDKPPHSPTAELLHPSNRPRDGSSSLSKRRPGSMTSLSSADSPRILSPPLTSPKASPNTRRAVDLRYHAFPPHSGQGNSVSSLNVFHNSRVLISLHAQGDLCVFAIQDGRCIATTSAKASKFLPPFGIKIETTTQNVWLWRTLDVISHGESTLLVAIASIDPSIPTVFFEDSGEPDDQSRIAVFELQITEKSDFLGASLTLLADWVESGRLPSIVPSPEAQDTLILFSVDSGGQAVIKLFGLRNESELTHLVPEHADHEGMKLASLNIPNPFKSLRSPSTEHLIQDGPDNGAKRFACLDSYKAGALTAHKGLVLGCRLQTIGTSVKGVVWTNEQLEVVELVGRALIPLCADLMPGVLDVKWIGPASYTVSFKDKISTYECRVVDANNDVVKDGSSGFLHPWLLYSAPLPPFTAVTEISERGSVVMVDDVEHGKALRLLSSESPSDTMMWSAPRFDGLKRPVYLTSISPIDMNTVLLGYNDGHLRQTSWASMSGEVDQIKYQKTSDTPLDASITSLHFVSNERTKERLVVGGGDDGSIAFWSLISLKLCARWTIFATPLANVIRFPDDKGPLGGCALCIAKAGTIAVVAIDGLQLLYLIPGAPAPLEQICLGGDNLLLFYSNQLARQWDVRTKEFWRSMTADKAHDLLKQGSWLTMSMDDPNQSHDSMLSPLPHLTGGLDCVSTLSLDIEHFIAASNAVTKTVSTGLEQTRYIYAAVDHLRSVLSTLFSWGLNDGIDDICHRVLSIPLSSTSYGISGSGGSVLYASGKAFEEWTISSFVTATRSLAIVATLRALALFEEYSDAANSVITFYTTALPTSIGSGFQSPSLPFLALKTLHSSTDIRHASKLIFDAAVIQLSEVDAIKITTDWHQYLPSISSIPDAEIDEDSAALALCVCGNIVAEKHSLMPVGLLTDVAKSIYLYLQSEHPVHRSLAIELCSRGFQIWQHYADAVEILRALFVLATTTRKDSISLHNIASQSRTAVMSIASSNTPLFMTTLSLDILNPSTMEYRKSVMQIVAYLIRKRPLVLYPNLPRLMEAVVKSLDPNSTSHRDAVLDTATQIISDVVKTFPTVDFHMGSQRLAVGTSEGAVIMYDLKTAIRLYVLEGHKKRLAACSFSPDGRRLVSVSLEENVVLVWKVGSSFSSFFNPGAPPRQGHGGSDPYKTLPFNVGQEADMTIAATLEWVRFEWTSDRSVKLKIRESVLTFST